MHILLLLNFFLKLYFLLASYYGEDLYLDYSLHLNFNFLSRYPTILIPHLYDSFLTFSAVEEGLWGSSSNSCRFPSHPLSNPSPRRYQVPPIPDLHWDCFNLHLSISYKCVLPFSALLSSFQNFADIISLLQSPGLFFFLTGLPFSKNISFISFFFF